MRHAVLRASFVLAVVMLVLGTEATTYGRGPAGRGGGGRAGGGPGERGRDLAKPELKKKDGPGLGAKGLGVNGGPTATLQNLGAAPQQLSPAQSKWQNAGGGAVNLQNLQPQAGQKFQSRDGRFQDGKFQQNAQTARENFQNGAQPFTADWYADHPAAWQYTHPHADAWAAATATGVAAWLGWAAYDANSANDGYGVYYNTTNVYEQPADESDDSNEQDPANDGASEGETPSASSTNDSSDWLALGVYSILSSSGEPTSRYLQLAVNRQGQLQGVYYDSLSNATQNIRGSIDQSTQTASWSIESNPQTNFSASLSDLTQPTGTIQVNQPSGQQQWNIAREQTTS